MLQCVVRVHLEGVRTLLLPRFSQTQTQAVKLVTGVFIPLQALTAFEEPKTVHSVCLGLYISHSNLHYALPCLGPTDSVQSSTVQYCQGQCPKSEVWTAASQGPAAPLPLSSLCHGVSQSAGWVGFNRISMGRFFPGNRGA